MFRGLRRTNVSDTQCVAQCNETDLQKATLRRLLSHVQRKPLDFTQRGVEAKPPAPLRPAHTPTPPVSGHESPPGLQP